MKRVYIIVAFVFMVCTASVGLVAILSAQSQNNSELMIEEAPVALGAESQFTSHINVFSEGSGSVEVSPYKAAYVPGDKVTFTPHPLDGWRFDRWEGDISGNGTVTIRMPDGTISVTAVFVEE